jgi:hypothetical protein
MPILAAVVLLFVFVLFFVLAVLGANSPKEF